MTGRDAVALLRWSAPASSSQELHEDGHSALKILAIGHKRRQKADGMLAGGADEQPRCECPLHDLRGGLDDVDSPHESDSAHGTDPRAGTHHAAKLCPEPRPILAHAREQ